jgi:hypothetical protein
MGHLLAVFGINSKPKQIMKTKILIPLAGLALFCACGGAGRYDSADSASTVLKKEKSTATATDSLKNQPKQVKTANIRFKVKSVQETGERIAALTTSLNGTVTHHFINSTTSDSVKIQKSNDSLLRITVLNTTAEMTVKIPPAKIEDFVNQVTHMGILIDNLKMDINDKSLEYLSTQLKLKNQKELIDNQKNGTGSPKDPDNLLAFKNNMIDQRISNLKTDDSVKSSTVTLNFYESSVINKETIANADLRAYNLPVTTQLGISFANGWQAFVQIIIFLANLWVLLPLGLCTWLLLRYNKRKKTADKSTQPPPLVSEGV